MEATKAANPYYLASISVHIPFSSLPDPRLDFKPTTQKIGAKTRTHIEFYSLPHLHKMRFCIFGKWRDCLQAGRLLWYQLIRETMIYIHFDWTEDLERPLRDQKDKPFKQLYRNVKFKPLNDYNLFSISGICWDVLKVRKELLRRSTSKTLYEQQMITTKTELTALQVLNCIRTDINDGIHSQESLYSIRNSQLLRLITGSKNGSPVDQIEAISYPKEFVQKIGSQETGSQKISEDLIKTKNISQKFKGLATEVKHSLAQNESQDPTLKIGQTSKDQMNGITSKPLQYSLMRLKEIKSNSIETKSEKIVLKKEPTIAGMASKEPKNMTQSETKPIETISFEEKHLDSERVSEKTLNTKSDTNEKTKEHKLIADRIQHLMDSQQKSESDGDVNKGQRNCSLTQQFINSKIFKSNESQTQNSNCSHSHRKRFSQEV